MWRIVVHLILLFLLLVLVLSTDSVARRILLTPEQKTQLANIQIIFISAQALSEKGRVPPDPIQAVVQRRFEDLGFQVVTDADHGHDVVFHVLCEERKQEQGVTRYGGDAELPDTPDRLWNGPACQLSYRLDGNDLGWYKEVRVPNEEVALGAKDAPTFDGAASAFTLLSLELERLDFPVMLLSEWGQTRRLVDLLSAPGTSSARQSLILDLLRQFPAPEALPHLLIHIQQGAHPEEAIGALSGLGREAVPHLLRLFEVRNGSQSIRAAAAKGLGRIARTEGAPDVMEALLEYLDAAVLRMTSSADIEFPVLTEVVWAVGSIHHEPTFQLIGMLQNRIWMIPDSSPDMKKLREVVSVVYKFLDLSQL
jgi:hypothetical protein